MSRIICVGDIHGCIDTFETLLIELNLKEKDLFISLGGVWDKGPASLSVSHKINSLNCEKIFIVGNHEDRIIRWFLKPNDERSMMREMENFVQESLIQEDIDWLLDGYLYYSFTVNNQKYICVHGGIAPEHTELNDELLIKDLFKLTSKPRKSLEKILRTRYITPEGESVKDIHSITQYDTYWAEIYNGRFGTALFGHQPFLNSIGPRMFPHAIGLDTGCVHGGALTALVLEEGEPVKSISVKNSVSYCPAVFSPHRFPV